MSTGTWHADEALLAAYVAGRTDAAASASVEAHLVACADCRAALAAGSDPVPLRRAWTGVLEAVQTPPLPLPLRLLRRLGLRDADAVLLSASQSLRGPWLLATVTLLVFAALTAVPAGDYAKTLYLLVAPLVPVVGVVMAFESADPTADLVASMPYPRARVALLRTAGVIATSVPLVLLMGASLPWIGVLAVATLGPGLGLTLVALVLLTRLTPEISGVLCGLTWFAVVGSAYGRHEPLAVVSSGFQLAYLAVALVAAAVLFTRFRSARHVPGGPA